MSDRDVFRRLRVAGIGLLGLIVCVEILRAGIAVYLHAIHSAPSFLTSPTFSAIVLVAALVFYRFVFEPAYRHALAVAERLEEQHQSDSRIVERFSSIFEHHSGGAIAMDANGRYVLVNAAMERLCGYRAAELIGRTFALTPSEYALTVHEAVASALSGIAHQHEMQLLCKDGTRCDVAVDLIPMREDGRVIGIFGFFKDIGEAKRARARERTQRDRFRAVAMLAGAGGDVDAVIEGTLAFAIETLGGDAANVAMVNDDDSVAIVHGVGKAYDRGTVVPIGQTFSRHIIGSREVLVVRDTSEEPWASDAARAWQPWRSLLATTLFVNGVPAGILSLVSAEVRTEIDDADRDFVQVVASLIASAIERKHREAHLQEMAFMDALTALPNRAYLSEQVELAIAVSRRENRSFALQYVDIDRFKEVNDRLGHAAGDQVLAVIAARLKMAARESDIVARIGGDEFVVLQTQMEGADAIAHLAARLVDAASEPVIVGDEVLRLGASIGVARFPDNGGSAEELLRHADEAMYRAKRSGRNRLEM